ncbi:hypothetical protein CSHOW_0598 [Campylobacter showae]|uniref:Uncharacterized protein n=1 Tax=Campylobacter showae RM3277 TaxID=553219 RepID=C6RFZ5_9BACT|nr:hypothetical protein CAMSH0001_2258 [Campylobacter showae RM3277]QCD48552.1 hypothetical protein CSHOW_0598 [Campylobacter showae]
MLLLKFDRFLRINLALSWWHFAACEFLPGGLYSYLYGVNLLNFASVRANSVVRLRAFACALCARSNLRACAGFAPLKFDVFLCPAQICAALIFTNLQKLWRKFRCEIRASFRF